MLRLAALAPVAIALWLMLLTFPTRATGPQLDDSWNTLLARALHLGLQAGVDVIFTYGPLAYLFSSHPPFDPTLHECRMGVDFVGKAVCGMPLFG